MNTEIEVGSKVRITKDYVSGEGKDRYAGRIGIVEKIEKSNPHYPYRVAILGEDEVVERSLWVHSVELFVEPVTDSDSSVSPEQRSTLSDSVISKADLSEWLYANLTSTDLLNRAIQHFDLSRKKVRVVLEFDHLIGDDLEDSKMKVKNRLSASVQQAIKSVEIVEENQ